MGDIVKVAILPIVKKELLMCVKDGLAVLVNLGDTQEEGETDEQTGRRECKEEAQCEVRNLRHYTTVRAPRADDPKSTIELRCYFGDLDGTPTPQPGDKIIGFEYITRHFDRKRLPPSMQTVMDKLISDNYL